jgi:hypothetical protein
VRAMHGKACARLARVRSRTRARVRLGHSTMAGMTGGPRQSAATGEGEERSALVAVVGRLD